MNKNYKKSIIQDDLREAINKTPCKKWGKWFNDAEEPYPCVCSVRDEYCIELELYHELQKVINLYNQEAYFKQALEEFELIDKQSSTALLSWIKRYQGIGSKLFFNTTITISRSSEKNDKLIIQLNPDEFSTVIQFQEIFTTV
ncbi:hypothetical protein E0W68_06080 [Flavobacterium salilacus subsp. salilacus]|uniref:hypothetical protein n=1 Tax=Flavobacterium TaxID=237 RepID=UPI0010751709|nr:MULTISPECIES: hypothetical protein [Flavobacterium]KAF2518824.1 hypothetical protein E0W68_06080 [Flavobacterium salilacus subsp. salilacus]MBE1615019.1 hypothetical protein [Flavobacterium sp. SaA2.13]